ncbi:hypothetical protein Chor_014774, partial [Crotalus horridus]
FFILSLPCCFSSPQVLSYKIEELGDALKAHYKIDEFSSVMVPVQEPVTVLGQIGCDSNGKLNPQSVILEGDRGASSFPEANRSSHREISLGHNLVYWKIKTQQASNPSRSGTSAGLDCLWTLHHFGQHRLRAHGGPD